MTRGRAVRIAVGTFIVALFMLAWIMKPKSLRSRIIEAGIPIESVDHNREIDSVTQRKLNDLLIQMHYDHEYIQGIDDSIDKYTLDQPFLFFWRSRQEVLILRSEGSRVVEFQPRIL